MLQSRLISLMLGKEHSHSVRIVEVRDTGSIVISNGQGNIVVRDRILKLAEVQAFVLVCTFEFVVFSVSEHLVLGLTVSLDHGAIGVVVNNLLRPSGQWPS